MPDIGGTVMGNYHPTAWELWQEGARFTPLKIVTEGKRRRSAFDTLLLNGRAPEAYRGDLDAVLATANVGRERLAGLIAAQGLELVRGGMANSIEYSERRFRAALARLPDGTFSGSSTLEHDGQGRRDLTVRVTMRCSGDGVALDFTGTDAQSAGFVNSPPSNTRAFALLPFLGLVDDAVPRNAGLLRALDVTTPEGTLVAPAYPAPTGWCREHVGFEIAEAVGQALAAALPEEAGVGHASRPLLFSIDKQVRVGGVEEQLGRTDYGLLSQPGLPANAHGDGLGRPGRRVPGPDPVGRGVRDRERHDGRAHGVPGRLGGSGPPSRRAGHRDRHPARARRVRAPLRLRRGGQRTRPTAGWAAARAGRRRCSSRPAAGPSTSRPSRWTARWTRAPGCASAPTGGGGWGDPRERDPARVRADVIAGYVSPGAAQSVYGVP